MFLLTHVARETLEALQTSHAVMQITTEMTVGCLVVAVNFKSGVSCEIVMI